MSAQCTVVGEINKEVEEYNTSESLINLIIKYGSQMEHIPWQQVNNTGIGAIGTGATLCICEKFMKLHMTPYGTVPQKVKLCSENMN